MEKIGKFITVSELGKGATSSVFLAKDPFNDQKVAIKVFDLDSVRGTSLEMAHLKLFLTEASLVGKLQHPHIVKILDAVTSDDLNYLVMEYVEGGSLENCTEADSLLPITTVAEIMFKCCRALEYAQTQGVLHRDVKPANIMLTGGSEIKISDFGAARVDDYEGTQVSGVGSPAYMSPEQIMDQPLTHQSDIYSLGVTMYKLLTGKLPFEASSSNGLIYQVTHGDPISPRTFRPDIPAPLNAIVLRAINKDLSKRYQNWNEFAQDLTSYFVLVSLNSFEQTETEIFDTEKFDILRSLSFFHSFRVIELWEVLNFSSWRKVHKGAQILQEGAECDTFYILASGTVKVIKNGKAVSLLFKGDCFGEMKRFPDSKSLRTTGIESETEVMLIEIKLDVLARASVECRFQFDDAFLYILLKRLSTANTRISQLMDGERDREYSS